MIQSRDEALKIVTDIEAKIKAKNEAKVAKETAELDKKRPQKRAQNIARILKYVEEDAKKRRLATTIHVHKRSKYISWEDFVLRTTEDQIVPLKAMGFEVTIIKQDRDLQIFKYSIGWPKKKSIDPEQDNN